MPELESELNSLGVSPPTLSVCLSNNTPLPAHVPKLQAPTEDIMKVVGGASEEVVKFAQGGKFYERVRFA